jgi:hypothetical protein
LGQELDGKEKKGSSMIPGKNREKAGEDIIGAGRDQIGGMSQSASLFFSK